MYSAALRRLPGRNCILFTFASGAVLNHFPLFQSVSQMFLMIVTFSWDRTVIGKCKKVERRMFDGTGARGRQDHNVTWSYVTE